MVMSSNGDNDKLGIHVFEKKKEKTKQKELKKVQSQRAITNQSSYKDR